MKRITLYILILCGILSASCQSDDISGYDKQDNYIYFDTPYKLDAYGNATSQRADSVSYSFALDDASIKDTSITIVAKTIGMTVDYDRPYTIQLVSDKSTVTDADWDASSIQSRTIPAGQFTDTIRIKVHRSQAIKQHWVQATLRLVPNEYFSIGYANLQETMVSFSDILAKPNWWKAWEKVFGEFSREKYAKWIEIYYLGADPNTSYDNHQPLYWDNMPGSPIASWYPVLFMNVRVLKQYFIDNEVYPDGDTSRPRITIPY